MQAPPPERGRFNWRPVQIGSLLEDRLLQAGNRRAGFDPQLLDERVAQPTVGAQGVGLPTIAIQGDHELARQPLPERVLTHQLGQLTYDGMVLARGGMGGIGDGLMSRPAADMARHLGTAAGDHHLIQVGADVHPAADR